MNELALFAGAGGGILGGFLLGWRTVCAVEINAYAAGVLCARQNDGVLPPFPVWDDIRTFDGRPWRGIVDVVSGGFPCQDISVAGKGKGLKGERSGLWREMARIIREARPCFAFIENSPRLVVLGLNAVLCDLAEMGYDAEWGIVSAANAGAPHLRERIWIVAHADSARLSERNEHKKNSSTYGKFSRGESKRILPKEIWDERKIESLARRDAYGVAARVDRIEALGNGQVPAVAALAWETLSSASTKGGL